MSRSPASPGPRGPSGPVLRELVRAARAARRRAYAPYSRYAVGASVLTGSGAVIPGCNVENASYGLSLCAERVAIHRAVAEGHRRMRAVAVVTGSSSAMPCGACRQVMHEFGVREVIVAGPRGAARVFRLDDLLSLPFDSSHLGQH